MLLIEVEDYFFANLGSHIDDPLVKILGPLRERVGRTFQ